jgi:hypothetical protein
MNGWPMKRDRELMALARVNPNIDKLAARLNCSPMTIVKAARRLGLKVGPQPSKGDRRFKV